MAPLWHRNAASVHTEAHLYRGPVIGGESPWLASQGWPFDWLSQANYTSAPIMEKDMPIIDISRPLYPGTAVWPGDSPFQMESVLTMASGASVNLTTLSLSAHTGTHADAPLHFSPGGAPVDRLDLRPYWGPARVVTVAKQQGPLLPADLPEVDFNLAPRLLIRSVVGQPDYGHFPEAYVYPSPSLADFLAERGVILFGSDAPSMDEEHSKALEGHHALRRRGIAILEWLDLSQAADGIYELTALPLRIVGGDGSPVRAALRSLERTSG